MTADLARKALTDALASGDGQGGSTGSVAGLDNFVVRGMALADAEVTRFDLVAAMADGVVSDVVKAVSGLIGKQFLDYDPSYQTNTSQVLVEDLTEIPELDAVDAVVRLGNVGDDVGGDQVVAMAHAVGTGAKKIVAYRLKGPGIATRRSKGITLIPRDGIYRPIEGDVLHYEPRFDALTCAGFAYFTTVTGGDSDQASRRRQGTSVGQRHTDGRHGPGRDRRVRGAGEGRDG